MANLKEIRRRISSVQSTQQITKAMKMVAAAKLRKAQNAVLKLRPYSEKLHEILAHISASESGDSDSPYTEKREEKRILIIGISSNKGLCGPFNTNVAKKIMELCFTDYSEQYRDGKLSIITAGRKVAEVLKSKGFEIAERHDELFEDMQFETIDKFASEIMERFVNKEFDKVEIVYNQFKNAAVQILIHEQFLPVEEQQANKDDHSLSEYLYEPSEDYIRRHLIPDSLKTQMYKAFLDSVASEHGARMTAMHKATDNAAELIKDLKLTYNKARQAAITTEINEITAGAEALSN